MMLSTFPRYEAAGYVLQAREQEVVRASAAQRSRRRRQPARVQHGLLRVDRMIRFRDHLRVDEADRALYERTKRDLAARRWRYVQDYADAKTDVIVDIMTRAQPLQ